MEHDSIVLQPEHVENVPHERTTMNQTPPNVFSFSLRTLLIVVTLLCCYLAWQVRTVQQRRS